MGCTIALLGTALAPTGYVVEAVNSSGELPVSPAVSCLFSTAKFNETRTAVDGLQAFNWLFSLVSLLFLLVSYVSRVISLFTLTANNAQFALISWPGYKFKKAIPIVMRKSKTGNIKTEILDYSIFYYDDSICITEDNRSDRSIDAMGSTLLILESQDELS